MIKKSKHQRHLTVKQVPGRLSKSSNFQQDLECCSTLPRKATYSNPLTNIMRMNSSPVNTFAFSIDSAKQNFRSRPRPRTPQSALLSGLYANILKHKHSHSRLIVSEKQKQRFLARFAQTFTKDCFKVTGFELDCQSLGFVFDYISQSSHITKVVLDGNPLGLEGIRKLAGLVGRTDIYELSLVSVGLNNKEAAILFQALTIKANIRKLNVSSVEGILKNKITSEGVYHLKTLLSSVKCCLDTLHMDYVLLGNEGLKTAFQGVGLPPLEQLSISKNDFTSKYIPFFIGNISGISLSKLDLSKNALGNEGLKVLTDMLGTNYGRTSLSIHLSYLNVSGNGINSFGLQIFCHEMFGNQTLQTLLLGDNPLGEGDRLFNIKYFIHKNWRLKTLGLANIACSDKQIRCICEGMETNRSLEELDLSKNEVDSDTLSAILTMLGKNRFLRKIALNGCKICDNFLIRNDSLITGTFFERIEEVELENNYIGNKGAELLKQMLVANQSIIKLSLGKNCIAERPLLSIAAVIKENGRRRPFEREMKYFEQVIDLYEEKKTTLKEEVRHLQEREERLRQSELIEDIRAKQKLKSTLVSQIKLQKRSIAKITKKIHAKTLSVKQQLSQQASSAFMTDLTPMPTVSEIQ